MAKTIPYHSPIERMIKRRSITIPQAIAFEELAALLIIHERGCFVRTSTTRKVKGQNGPDAFDAGRRAANLAQFESAFALWEREMGKAAAIACDFARGSLNLADCAKKYGMRFGNARAKLLAALDRWTEIRHREVTGVAPTGF